MNPSGCPVIRPDTVVFDLGGVLIDWNPRHLYRKLFDNAAVMEQFLATVCNHDWVIQQDGGRPFAEGVAELVAIHPEKAELIEAYWRRWPEMIAGAVDGTVAILRQLKDRSVPVYALSNWSVETWPYARDGFAFLEWFDGMVISGFEGTKKPDARIFRLLLERYRIEAARAVFIDDLMINVVAARNVGLHALHFTDAQALRRDLTRLKLLSG